MKTAGTANLLFHALLLGPAVTAQGSHSESIDHLFAKWDRKDSPGAAVLVVQKGKVVHRKGYGMADLEQGMPITPRTVFDIASLSKQFCGLAIAMLVEQGKLDVDDDVRKHVPWVPDFGAGRVIRIRNLVHHTSGLRDWPGALRLAGFRYDDVITFAQILKMLRRQRDLNFDPGARYLYSNTGYNLLAHVVEKQSGMSFATWTKGHLFDPLGMRDTHFHDDHTCVVPNRATAYRRARDGWYGITDNLTAVGSSSLFTTIDDLANWVLNFETRKVGGKAAIDRMHTRGKLNDGTAIAYCYGVSRGEHDGLDTVSHSGSWAGFRTFLVRYPAQRFAVAVLANTATVDPRGASRKIAELYLGEVMQRRAGRRGAGASAVRAAPPGLTAEQLQGYTGRYHSAELDTTYTVAVAGRGLAMRHFRNDPVTLRAVGKDRFAGSASWVGTVRFVRDGAGEVTVMTVSNGRCHHIRFDRAH